MIYSQHRQNFRACGGQKTRARRARAGQLDYPPSIEHPRHLPRGRRLPGFRPRGRTPLRTPTCTPTAAPDRALPPRRASVFPRCEPGLALRRVPRSPHHVTTVSKDGSGAPLPSVNTSTEYSLARATQFRPHKGRSRREPPRHRRPTARRPPLRFIKLHKRRATGLSLKCSNLNLNLNLSLGTATKLTD